MKRILLISAVILFSGMAYPQFNLSFLQTNAQKGEAAGKILVYNQTGDNFILIGTDTLYISPGYKAAFDLNTKKRVHAFFKKDVDTNKKILTKINQEDFLNPSFIYCIPIIDLVWANAATGIYNYPEYKELYGNITSWGYGVNASANVYYGVKVFAEMMSYTYSQEIAEAGENIHSFSIYGGSINMPLGLKYNTYTTSIRLGGRYTFFRDKMIQPFVGLTYGANVWNVKYVSWDEKHYYGKANGTTMRHSLQGGVNFEISGLGTIMAYFDMVAPVASYKMDNLFGIGEDYSQFDAMTYPVGRFNIGIMF